MKTHTKAILAALFVAFLWSTSWILIKNNIEDIPPLLFAGIRYMLASIILLPGLLRYKTTLRQISLKEWAALFLFGLIYYTIAQGAQFITLKYMGAISFSLMLNFTTILVAIIGIYTLKEIPTLIQWSGIAIFLIGVLFYFIPLQDEKFTAIGLSMAFITILANAIAGIQGRAINRTRKIPFYVVTTTSMTIGATLMLASGLIFEDFPSLSSSNWGALVWLAVVNTAFAFTIWTKTQQILTAVESSIINNTMLIQIAILAWIFLREPLSLQDVFGLALVAVGTLLTNWKPAANNASPKTQYSD
ncbi:MAG: DMT family transporter [Anaerolineaceae bacterium]